MAKKIKLTRPELKRQRDALRRFERYLPMLKLKQQQLQLTLREIAAARAEVQQKFEAAREKFDAYRKLMGDLAGVDIESLATPEKVQTKHQNIAGVNIPIFEGVTFAAVSYSLFATPAWVDRALADRREVNAAGAELDILDEQYRLINAELSKIIQRVNLFEKVKIPDAKEAIHVIRIHLGDQMTAAVGRAKIAKNKLEEIASGADDLSEWEEDETDGL